MDGPINEALQEIGNDSWLIAGKLLLSRQTQPPAHQPSWSDANGSFFTISKAPQPLSEPSTPPNTISLSKVYEAGGASVVWRAGEAFIKLHKIHDPNATREHVTIDYVRKKGRNDFDIPEVYYFDEFKGLYCMVCSRLPGLTLGEAWPTLSEDAKQAYVCRIADICDTLMQWKGSSISGVDGGHLLEYYLQKEHDGKKDLSPQNLLRNSLRLGMDNTAFGFFHCDLGAGNIIVDGDRIGIIDWEIAGFVPREWVVTKFRISSGLDLPTGDTTEWRRLVSRKLSTLGYKDVVDEYVEWS